MTMKTLIVLSATPGSGKSTWAKLYKDKHPNTIILSSDEVRFEVTGNYQDFSRQKEVWEIYENRIVEYGKKDEDFTLILDALNDLNSIRQRYLELGKDFDKKVLVVIKKPYDITTMTNKERDEVRWVPEDALKALNEKFEMPDIKTVDMYDEYELVDYYF